MKKDLMLLGILQLLGVGMKKQKSEFCFYNDVTFLPLMVNNKTFIISLRYDYHVLQVSYMKKLSDNDNATRNRNDGGRRHRKRVRQIHISVLKTVICCLTANPRSWSV